MSNLNRLSPVSRGEPKDRSAVEESTEGTWFCRIGGTVYGPVNTQTLKRWVAEQRLMKTDEIKRRVDGQFVSASWYAALFDDASGSRAAISSNNPSRTSPSTGVTSTVTRTKSPEKPQSESAHTTSQATVNTVAEVAVLEAMKTTKQPTDDDLLRTFAEQFAARKINSFARIGLDVKQGVVRLEGTVPTEGEYLLLIHVIRNTPGVVTIKDGLLVAGRNPPGKKAKAVPSIPRSTFIADTVAHVTSIIKSKRMMNAAISVASILLLIGGAAVALQAKSFDTAPTLFPAKGTATLDGKPMAGASIVLYRVDAGHTTKGVHSRAIVDEEGHFELGTVRPHDGAPLGDYVATIVWTKQSITNGKLETTPNLAPAKYASRESTDLKVTVSKGTNQIPAFSLKSE